jgi:hypothetical protein
MPDEETCFGGAFSIGAYAIPQLESGTMLKKMVSSTKGGALALASG